MPSYLDLVSKQTRSKKRPSSYDELLFNPVSDNPEASQAECYQDWEFDHGSHSRFYVGGFRWFLRQTGWSANQISEFARAAVETVNQETNWHEMPESGELWSQPVARVRFNSVKNGEPQRFAKAAMVVMACELAVADALNNGREFKEIESPEDIYGKMTIIPACWNIDDFNQKTLAQIDQTPGAMEAIKAETGQRNSKVFEQLASGNAVTWETANKLKKFLERSEMEHLKVGEVRARPGRMLGRKKASDEEEVDKG